ncbi:phosphate signaling complex protein PhoU [Thalassobacillus pellis]|uniref:phosphate signaling complex protein PhoU n=1 Tax=Thalassobacillus pellis TaxID=748008 RepID=UPI0030840ADC|nr:phosphate transport system protein [Thalassobacillus pellis]
MTFRMQFEEDLNTLRDHIKELAIGTKKALRRSVDALYNKDIHTAREIMEDDSELDAKEEQINEEAILMIAKQQPVATDLRRLIIALKISSDLERMADHATNIAKATIHLGEDHTIHVSPEIQEMADVALDMLDLSIKAFENEDITLAKKLGEMDDIIDNKYGSLIREMLEQTAVNPEQIQHVMQMAFSARFIERFADHITNIGENIFYLVKGKTYDLND